MSKTLSLKLRDDVFAETEVIRKRDGRPRNGYINDAIDFYNRLSRRRRLARLLTKESQVVAAQSLEILSEFEAQPTQAW